MTSPLLDVSIPAQVIDLLQDLKRQRRLSYIFLPGCRFHTRCVHAQQRCRNEEPALRAVGMGGTLAACHFAESIAAPALVPEAEPPDAARLAALRRLAAA